MPLFIYFAMLTTRLKFEIDTMYVWKWVQLLWVFNNFFSE